MQLFKYFYFVLSYVRTLGKGLGQPGMQNDTLGKYFNKEIEAEYKKIEAIAEQRMLEMVPDEFKDDYRSLFISEAADPQYKAIVKAADTLCAYLKCLEEQKAGNSEFNSARKRLEKMLDDNPNPAVAYFRDCFIPSFTLNLDEINQML